MNERVLFTAPIKGTETKGAENELAPPPQFCKNGGDNRRTPISLEAERAARSTDGGFTARAWAYYEYGIRCCRVIIARHDWVRLEESLSQQFQSVCTFSEDASNRAVFEGHEPTVVDMRISLK